MQKTAEGVFRVIDKASAPITKIKSAGAEMDKTITGAGKALDNLDSPQITNSIRTTERNTAGLGRTVENTGRKIETTTNKAGRAFEQMAAKGTASVEELTAALRKFEHERATATMDVDIAKAEAKIRLIKHELRTVSTANARAELQSLGLVANEAAVALGGAAGGGGGGPPTALGGAGGGGLRASILGVTGGLGLMVPALIAAAPAVVALTGAVSALAGSLGAAIGGAGALGIGGLSAFVVGVGSIVAVAKPAINDLKELKKAQDGYNKAVQQYGRDSAQAAQAQRTLSRQQRQAPGAASVLRNAGVLSRRWRNLTGGAREDFFGILNEGLETANSLLPTFGGIANRVLSSVRRAVEDLLRPFRGSEWRGIFRDLGDTFARFSGPALRSIGNLALFFGRIARAASPMVIRMFEKLEDWTSGLARGVSNRERTANTVERLVGHLRDWVKMGGAAVRLMATFFGAGAQQGQSIVQGITEQFDKWTEWLKEHPGEVQDFFERTIDSAGKLVTAIGNIASEIGKIADALIPVLNMFSDLVNLVGGAGMLGPLALAGGLAKFGPRLPGIGGLMAGGAGRAAVGATGAGAAGGAMGGIGLRTAPALYRASTAAGAGRVAALGGTAAAVGSGALRAAGKAAWPVMAGLAAWDFATYQGNVMQRAQNALSGATFGLINRPVSDAEHEAQGTDRAAQWLGQGRSTRDLRGQVGHLERLMGATTTSTRDMRWAKGESQTVTKPVLDAGTRKDVQAQLDALRPVLKTQVRLEQTQAAMRSMDELARAFDTRWNRLGSKAAEKGFIGDLRGELKKLKPDGDRELLHATASWTATMETGTKAQRRIAEHTKNEIVRQYRHMGREVRVINGEILDITRGKWQGVYSAIMGPTERANQESRRAFTEMQKAAVDALRMMGYSPGEARGIIGGLDPDARKTSRNAAKAALRSGPGSYDAGIASGSLAGPAMPGAMPKSPATGATLQNPFGDGIGNQGRSGVAAAQSHGSRGATARAAAMVGVGGTLMGAKPGMSIYAREGARFGLRVSSGRRPGSITSSGNVSFHSSGDALDLAGSPRQMMAFARYMSQNYGPRLEELIYTPLGRGQVKNGQNYVYTGAVASDHYDHVHVADTQPGGASGSPIGQMLGGMGRVRLPRRRSRAGGVPGALSNRVTDIAAAGMERRVNAIAQAAGLLGGGGMPGGALPGGYGGGAMTFQQVAALAESVGLPGIAFAQIARGESGFNPRAIGHDPGGTRGLGLWQITTKYNDDIIAMLGGPQAMLDPMINARAAKMIYDRQGIKAWYGTRYLTDPTAHYQGDGEGFGGIRMNKPEWGGWHARGGEFVARRPTIIGVGEGGAERVKISRVSDGGGGRRPIYLHVDKIVNYEEGDIEEILQRELAKVADGIERGSDDDELDG